MLFNAAFWTSIGFEMTIPVILTSAIFWSIVMPKAIEMTEKLARNIANTLKVEPCNTLLQYSLPRLIKMRANLQSLEPIRVRDYVLATNIMFILTLVIVSVIAPLVAGVSTREIVYVFLEVLSIYAIVVISEVYFIKEVAFKYAPTNANSLFKEILARFAYACFDTTVQDAPMPPALPVQIECSKKLLPRFA